MSLSVNTNQSALTALQNLSRTNDQLQVTQNTIATGLKVSSAKDNSSVYAIAQHQRADQSALGAVTDSLSRASSIADVANTAGSSISDLLNQLKQKVVAAQDPSLTDTSRAALDTDFKSLVSQIGRQIKSAVFNGANVLDGSITNGLKFLATADGASFVTLSTQNLSLGGSNITFSANSSVSTATLATAVLTKVSASIDNVNLALAKLGAQSTAIDNHNKFVSKLNDALTTGVGHLVDADLAAESAKLQALQVKQQLGTQALSIANQGPQSILSLFKG